VLQISDVAVQGGVTHLVKASRWLGRIWPHANVHEYLWKNMERQIYAQY
jgi:hypothetical protein